MIEKELKELEDPATWDSEHGEERPGVRDPRAVVSVAFSAREFQEVAAHARKSGLKLSEFIRDAALAQARHHAEV